MNEAEIRKYAELMKELGLTGLEITQNDQTFRMERNVACAQTPMPVTTENIEPEKESKDDGCSVVRSPIVGVFYAAPAENAAPFVRKGDRVKKGQTLCVIEAMKLMNEIMAEEDGVIAEICITNGQMVEYGTELFRIKR